MCGACYTPRMFSWTGQDWFNIGLIVVGVIEAAALLWLAYLERSTHALAKETHELQKATLRLEEGDRRWQYRIEVLPTVITRLSHTDAASFFQIANVSPAGISVSRLDVCAKRPQDSNYHSRPCSTEEAAVIAPYSSVRLDALPTLRQLPEAFPTNRLSFPVPIQLYISVHFTAHGEYGQQDSRRYSAELTNTGFLQNLKEL